MTKDEIQNLLMTYQKDQKVNYDDVLKKVMKKWHADSIRPTVLMHSCCAPCSTVMLESLCEHCDVTVYFSNSNIYPQVEYDRRALVQKEFVEAFNASTGNDVKFIEAPYKPNAFVKMVKEGHLEEEPEGGKRCNACFDMRLDSVAKEAARLGFDYFGSAITLSPHKNSQLVNAVGLDVQKLYDVSYLPSDFKKNNGYKRSVELCHDYDIYRQCYCGCIFAARKQGVDLMKISQEAKEFIEQKKNTQ